MKTSPELSVATPRGWLRLALAAGPPSPEYTQVPVPTTVEITPVEADTSRTRQLAESAIRMFPERSTATPEGLFTIALMACPPSPEYPQVPVPATVEMMPV